MVFLFCLPSLSRAQAYQPHSTCGTGKLFDDAGTCRPIDVVLGAGGGTVYWVAQHHAQASDTNPGTKTLPWKTISRATGPNVLRPGDAVIVREGTYRESIRPRVGGAPGQYITFAAYTGEPVVVTGADPLNGGWTQAGNAWRHTWTLPLNAYPKPWTPHLFRREIVIVDGTMLMPVYARADVVPGTFFVEGTDVAPTAIYMRLPGDAAPSGHQIEVGTRHPLFEGADGQCSSIKTTLGWFRVIGFTFRHAVNRAQWGAICPGAEGSLLEDNTVEWTVGTGIRVYGRGHVLRGNRAVDNGQVGIGGGCNGCLLEYNEASRNNWKGWRWTYEAGGGKWTNLYNTRIRHHLAQDNDGPGLWLDAGNADNTIEGSRFVGNLAVGLMLENETVRITVSNNVFFGTRWANWTGSGLLTQASSHNVIVHNTFMANEGTGLWIRPDPAGRAPDGYNKIYNNLIVDNATAPGQNTQEISLATLTNVLDGNLYWSHENIARFTFWFGADQWKGNDIATWRQLTGQDAAGDVLDPAFPVVEDSFSPTGWRLVAGSQALGRGVALPASVISVLEDIDGNIRPAVGADVGAHQFSGGVPSPAPGPGQPIGELGTLVKNQPHANAWHTVTLTRPYNNPVVILSLLSYNGAQPTTLRVRNVAADRFEFQLDEWDYADGAHTSETVGYLVVEAGTHTLEDGRRVQAGLANAGTNPVQVDLAAGFGAGPVVLSQAVTTHDARAVVTRHRQVTQDGFTLYIQGQEANPGHGSETVAWVAFEAGVGQTGGLAYEAGVTADAVTDGWYAIPFAQSYAGSRVVLAAMQRDDGANPAGLRLRGLTASRVEVRVEEEQSADAEMTHTTEPVGYVVFAPGDLFSVSPLASVGSMPAHLNSLSSGPVSESPDAFALEGNYPNPFNPETVIRYALAEPVAVRLEVYNTVGQRVAVLVDEAQSAGVHEAVFAGSRLPSGVYFYRLQAGPFTQIRSMILAK